MDWRNLMDLNSLKLLAAASLLGGSVREAQNGRNSNVYIPDPKTIEAAVEVAEEIWEEVLRREES